MNPRQLWQAWTLAKTWGVRPSEIFELEDPLTRYSFDHAVSIFGSRIEAEMDEAGAGAKNSAESRNSRQRVLDFWLYPEGDAPVRGRFQDPAAAGGIVKL